MNYSSFCYGIAAGLLFGQVISFLCFYLDQKKKEREERGLYKMGEKMERLEPWPEPPQAENTPSLFHRIP